MGHSAATEQPSPPLATRHTVEEEQARTRPLILVVEDNAVNQKLAVRLLEKMGYRADIAANGVEAIAAIERIPYAAILMDCQMPEMDGFEATKIIRGRETNHSLAGRLSLADSSLHVFSTLAIRIPIIAMTANAMQGDQERCLESGMDDYISKPIKPELLKTTLQRWLSQAEERSAQEAA